MKRFTDKWLKSLKPSDKIQEFNAGDGFLLRVAKSGSKTFFFRYKQNGKKKFIKLGTYPDCTLENAKKKHLDAWSALKNGVDPSHSLSEITTLGELAEDWFQKYVLVNRKRPDVVRQFMDADVLPSIGNLKFQQVTTRKLVLFLEQIVQRGAKVHANKILSTLKQMYNYGISKGIVDINPLQHTKAMDVGGKEIPRERNLSMLEVKQLWSYLDSDSHRMTQYTILAIKLLILSGCRLSEVREARWNEFNFNERLWTIPKERYKTGIEHKVYLTDLMFELLTKLKSLAGDSCFILPSTDKPKEKPLSDKALGRAILRSQGKIGIEKFTIHDLRRTFASRMADTLDIDIVVIEKLLGHKLPKIMATYQKDEMLGKRQYALEAWSDKIQMLVNNDNIVILKTS